MTLYLSPAEYAALMTKPKRSKYHAKPVVVTPDGVMVEAALAKARGMAGERFDSKAEGSRYLTLLALERAGRIHEIKRQPRFDIHARCAGLKKCGAYVADFEYFDVDADRIVVEDVKGVATPLYKFKKKLVEAEYGVTIREVR